MDIEERKFFIDGIELNYTRLGKRGKPLIIIQGWKNWWETFTKEALLNTITDANLQVFAFDTPQWDTTKGYFNTLEKFCFLIKTAMDHLDLPKASICGQSRGAVITLLFAATYPERVEKLILASPPATIMKRKGGRTIARHFIGFTRESPLLLKILDRFQKNYWVCLLTTRFAALYHFDKELLDTHIYPAALKCDLRIGLLNDESTAAIDWEDILTNVSTEAAIITGEMDPVSRVSDCKELQNLLPGTKLFVIPETRHGIMMEKPHEFAKLIVDFVSS